MLDRKRRKYNDDCRIFNEKWSINYFFNMRGENIGFIGRVNELLIEKY